jgi:hypothetical protein
LIAARPRKYNWADSRGKRRLMTQQSPALQANR